MPSVTASAIATGRRTAAAPTSPVPQIAMSRGVADQLAALSPRAEITVIGNGVDAAAFDTGVRAVDDRRDVVFVGRLEIAQKGLDLLIDAWARVAPLVEGRLVVAGTGPDEDVLRARVERLGLAD